MANKLAVMMVDDLDGAVLAEGHETIQWSLDGRPYEFDTSAQHAAAFRALLEPYQQVSRTVATRRASNSMNTRARTRTQQVREWAMAQGHEPSARGRLPAAIHDAYNAAHH